ncbi:MAG: glycine zipper 2TM domain-containing protein [Pseudomonadota bacterium]
MSIRHLQIAAIAAAAATLAACGNMPQYGSSAPQTTYPQASVGSNAPMSQEYGRVTNIEQVAATTTTTGSRPPNVMGAVVGGVAGAVLGRQVGGGSGRTAATVLGGVAGAAVGSQVGRADAPTTTTPSGYLYRISVQTDQGLMRQYEVNATGDLRVGDRVRVENGVIYRY